MSPAIGVMLLCEATTVCEQVLETCLRANMMQSHTSAQITPENWREYLLSASTSEGRYNEDFTSPSSMKDYHGMFAVSTLPAEH